MHAVEQRAWLSGPITCCDRKKKGNYTAHNVDVLVAHVIPLDLWYAVLFEAFPARSFYLKAESAVPASNNREAWRHLRPKHVSPAGPQIHAGCHLERRAACPERVERFSPVFDRPKPG
ncbi:MAG TPA: hypothetical protein VE083_05575 [Terriglobales bacterium]|nr:hypothetical protein [Terriglobales bacterium]